MILILTDFIAGRLLVFLRGGDAERFFSLAVQKHVPLSAPSPTDGGFVFFVPCRAFSSLRPLARRTGVRLHILKKEGLPFLLRPMKARPGLWGGGLLALGVLYALSFFLWSIDVTGVSPETAGRIRASLAEKGLRTGAFLPSLDPVDLKSQLLIELDELDWVAVNLRGTHAHVSAAESAPRPEARSLSAASPADLTAKKEGVVLDTRILRGEQLIFPGAAVREGEVIASHEVHGVIPGSKELSGAVRHVHAAGEVIARTEGDMSVYIPSTRLIKRFTGREYAKNRLFFAGNLIKFSKTYGNPYSNSDIIKTRLDLSLPGGRVLPLTLEKTEEAEYDLVSAPFPGTLAAEEMQRALEKYLLARAEKGNIEEISCVLSEADGLWRLDAHYIMTEDIGEEVLLSP